VGSIYLTIGFLGSGKSAWAKKFAADNPNAKIVSADSFREMFNGEYKYLVELDEIITESMVYAAKLLVACNYDVIIDCGNLTKGRRSSWMSIPSVKKIAVMLPQKPAEWHIKNRLKKPHWDVNWKRVVEGERKAFEPINEAEFDEIINVKEWEDG